MNVNTTYNKAKPPYVVSYLDHVIWYRFMYAVRDDERLSCMYNSKLWMLTCS